MEDGMSTQEITREIAAKVLQVVDAGLVKGVGVAKPGQMCVEAAVCYALGLPHGDDPECVSRAVRALKINLNDKNWSSNKARAKGLRRLAIAQLGSRDAIDDREFVRRVAELAIRTCVPTALRAAASMHKDPKHKAALIEAASRCERDRTREAAIGAKRVADAAAYAAASAAAYDAYAAAYDAASAAAYAAADDAAYAAAAAAYASYASDDDAARDKILSDFAEGVVQVLISMNAPGCQFLDLAPAA
jgi:hypothetical protein